MPISAVPSDDAIGFGPFQLFPARQLLLEAGRPVRLGSRALEILAALVDRPGELVSKRELIARVWPNTVVEESNLKVHVSALRRVLGDGRGSNRYLLNVPGRGYRFIAPVSRSDWQPPTASIAVTTDRPHDLPAPLTRILGRGEILDALPIRLKQRRLVTIVGPGGIGKTTVALAVADASISSYRDGARFLDLAPLADPLLVPTALATLLGVAVYSENPLPGLIAFLRDKQMLIVLDSCEHVVDAAAALAEALLKSVPGLHILVTSREPLRAAGERIQHLSPLDTPPTSGVPTAAEALAYSAVQLFVERAAERSDAFELLDTDAPFAAEICSKLDGNALAIELAAGRVDLFGVRGVAQRLDDRFELLTNGRRTALPRHRTLSAMLDWSYDLLSEIERIILRRLAVFAGRFTLEAATAVATSNKVAACDVLDGVTNLVAKSLISADVSGAVAHYRLLDTTRAYAREKLTQSGELEQSARRHAEYYRDLFERAEAESKKQNTADWLCIYNDQIDNARAALDWAFSPVGDAALGVALTIATVPLWVNLSLVDEGRKRATRALTSLETGTDRAARQQMQLCAALGVALYSIGPGAESKAAWTNVLKISENFGDTDYQLRALWGLWVISVTGGKHRKGLSLARKFAGLSADISDPLALFVGDRLMGTSLHFLGEHEKGRSYLQRALSRSLAETTHRSQIVRFQFDQSVCTRAYSARILWLQGYPDQAFRAAESSVVGAQVINHSLSVCYALAQAACPIALFVGDLAAAQRGVAMLLDESARHVLALWHIMGRCFHGALLVRRGDWDTGLASLRAAVDDIHAAGFNLYHTAFLAELAEGFGGVGQYVQAFSAIDEALAQSKRNEELWCLPELLRIKGDLSLMEAAPHANASAERHFLESLDLARQQKALSWELRTATSLARLRRNQGRVSQAHKLLLSTYTRFTEGFETADLKAAQHLLEELS